MNLGAFAMPERNLIFDINDFDQTLPVRGNETSGDWPRVLNWQVDPPESKDRERAVQAVARSYREHMAGYARMRVLDIWYQRIDFEPLVRKIPEHKDRELNSKEIDKARRNSCRAYLPNACQAQRPKPPNQGPSTAALPRSWPSKSDLSPAGGTWRRSRVTANCCGGAPSDPVRSIPFLRPGDEGRRHRQRRYHVRRWPVHGLGRRSDLPANQGSRTHPCSSLMPGQEPRTAITASGSSSASA